MLDVLRELLLQHGFPIKSVLFEERLDLFPSCQSVHPSTVNYNGNLLAMGIRELISEVDGNLHDNALKNS